MDTAPPNRSDSSASDGAATETLIRVETGPLPVELDARLCTASAKLRAERLAPATGRERGA